MRNLLPDTEMDWRNIAFIGLGLASIVPAHVAGFALGLPDHLRLFLDSAFFASFSYQFIAYAVLSGLLARYFPVVLLGIFGFSHQMRFDRIYYQKGYRRAFVSFTGFGNKARKFKNLEDLSSHLKRASIFGRNEARLANLRKQDFQKRFPVGSFETHRWLLTSAIAITIFCILYIGFARTVLVLLLISILFVSLISYETISSKFRFNLDIRFWTHASDPPKQLLNLDSTLALVTILAVASVMSGYLRVGYLSRSGAEVVGLVDDHSVSVLATMSAGIIAHDGSSRDYFFVPWNYLNTAP